MVECWAARVAVLLSLATFWKTPVGAIRLYHKCGDYVCDSRYLSSDISEWRCCQTSAFRTVCPYDKYCFFKDVDMLRFTENPATATTTRTHFALFTRPSSTKARHKAWGLYGSSFLPFLVSILVLPIIVVIVICVYSCRKTRKAQRRTPVYRYQTDAVREAGSRTGPSAIEMRNLAQINIQNINPDRPPDYEEVTSGLLSTNTGAADLPPPYEVAIKQNNNNSAISSV